MTASGSSLPVFDSAALATALRDAGDDEERMTLLREFVRTVQDDAASSLEVDALVLSEPLTTGDPRWDAVVAGVAEWVADKRGSQPAPSWVDAPDRFLDRWFHVERTGFGRAGALAHAPAAFRRRGVLVDPLGLVSDGVAL